jgi:hypothetical protein
MHINSISKSNIYGIDFSGAKHACKKIWISKGTIDNNSLHINECRPLSDHTKNPLQRDQCLAALKSLITSNSHAAFGLDFPFGLPETLINEDNWEEFILKFPEQYSSPDQFRQTCRNATDNKELKRLTDNQSRAPFSPYNLRIYRQTYFGIHDVLYPLVMDRSACILPMQHHDKEKPCVFEICPASTLKHDGLYYKYKGNTGAHKRSRTRILDCLVEKELIDTISSKVRTMAIEDTQGDALDSIIAAAATYRALLSYNNYNTEVCDVYEIEGYIFI